MKNEFIKIRGARVNNLKNINIDIPRGKLIVITGVSGSGKSSLAFDTIYAEGQRRYFDSLSTYAKQFLEIMDKPDVDKIEGISPVIAIEQKKLSHNPRSTVGTITEIYDYLRLLFSKAGKYYCYNCGKEISKITIKDIVNKILKFPLKSEITILSSFKIEENENYKKTIEKIKERGFKRVRIDGIFYFINDALKKEGDLNKKYNIEVIIDGFILDKDLDKKRILDSLSIALKLGEGTIIINQKSKNQNKNKDYKGKDFIFSERYSCENCHLFFPDLEPRLFSFNNPYGACPECKGLGEKLEPDPDLIIPNKNLTINEGAILPFVRMSQMAFKKSYVLEKIKEVSQKYKFSLDEEVKDLPADILNLILYGEKNSNEDRWQGVVYYLKKKYEETNSDWLRRELESFMVVKQCPLCLGKKLRKEALMVKVFNKSINKISEMSVEEAKIFFEEVLKKEKQFKKEEANIVLPILKEIISRLDFLIDVGLSYLTLDRKAITLSGGEEQRIRLSNQLCLKLTGVIYVLDEPSIGLHPKDQKKLIDIFKKLRDFGNTVIVVEHDYQTIKNADWIIEVGPGAGNKGGKIVFEGTPKELSRSHTITGDYFSQRKKVEIIKKQKTEKSNEFLIIKGAREHNLKNINVKIPLKKFVCITGVSGSGKSSLVNDILAKFLLKKFYGAKEEPGKFKEILGLENLNKVVLIDQSPIGRNLRSNPATYTGIFSYIRDIFSKTKEAKIKGFNSDKFSFNVKGGRCERCEGQGKIKVEMFFLPDIYIECQECNGKRFSRDVLEIKYKGKNIFEILSLTIEEAMTFFKDSPILYQKLKILKDIGLSYLELGQPAPYLSGGEAQRIKLATELSKKDTGKTIYILDEPTTGLHPDDILKLIKILESLVEKGNTILTVEHNLDFIKNADYIIDLGPEAGEAGGYIVAEGTPYDIIKNKKSYTGKYLKLVM